MTIAETRSAVFPRIRYCEIDSVMRPPHSKRAPNPSCLATYLGNKAAVEFYLSIQRSSLHFLDTLPGQAHPARHSSTREMQNDKDLSLFRDARLRTIVVRFRAIAASMD